MSQPTKDHLKAKFVGQSLHAVPTPTVVLDLAKLTTNCERMLSATTKLGLLWRAHIKSHKTTELTRLQVGTTPGTPVSLIASTILEAENIVPLLKEYQSQNRTTNLLLGFPLFPSAVPRLTAFTSALGPASLSVLIDHPSQLHSAAAIAAASHPPLVFIKIDAGYGRAGVVPSSPSCNKLIDAVLEAEKQGSIIFYGLYCHAGHSYGARKDWEAMRYLAGEFVGLAGVARAVREKSPGHGLVLSVGATPTATTVQNEEFAASEVGVLWAGLKEEGFGLEVHAGVYPTLDLQQLATRARDSTLLNADDIAVSVVAEVASVYPGRGVDGTTEALVTAGNLALGREPVADKGEVPGKAYNGWGFVMPWGKVNNPGLGANFPDEHDGWQVGRISQEHGILTWTGKKEDEVPLEVGDKIRIWPNHSCITGACYDYYLIVDSRNKGREDEVVDVWPRWRGW